MLICDIWLFVWYFPQFRKSNMSKYGYLEVFQRVPSTLTCRESTVQVFGVFRRQRSRRIAKITTFEATDLNFLPKYYAK